MKTREQSSTASPKVKKSESFTGLFPIAGIGASAGGLEALEHFFVNVPEKSGIAYVVIQHLDPTQKGMLPELLQRICKMEVHQAKDMMVVEPDCVYVIPPNRSMSILNGILRLFASIEIRGMRLPVDFFLRSLADDRKEQSIGIILSGMGSDGSLGLRAIKEKNGIVMVQEPATAKFDSMPRNAIDAVVVDIVAPPDALPEKLSAFLKQTSLSRTSPDPDIKDKHALEKIIILLRRYTGNDFSVYKKNTLYRRIERRMGIHKIDEISSYVNFLQDNPKEGDILFKELMIGVTSFFRDHEVWEELKERVIPDLIDSLKDGSVLRAWVTGVSSGEEAYSLAMVFKEALEKNKPSRKLSLQIFATDIDEEAIGVARKGIFPVNIATDVSPDRLNRFFNDIDEGYRVKNELREMVVFAQHNLIMHPPFINIDMLFCRNLLIYMDSEPQKRIIELFYHSIRNEGIMVLGKSETIGTLNHLFIPLDSRLKIYKRSHNTLAPDLFNFPSSFSHRKPVNIEKQSPEILHRNIKTLAEELLLQHFSPPGVLVNHSGDIIYISGHTGKYLEPATGKANMNIFAMLREGLRSRFYVAFHKAIMQKEQVVINNVKIDTNGYTQTLNIYLQSIDKPKQLKGMVMIIFADVPKISKILPKTEAGKSSSRSSRISELENELQSTREEMQSSVEEMQTSQEELKSTNEELQSTNEELQSTNEELTTSKEEMQSMNEELQTVNAELQAKLDEFSRVDNDMKNLLNSTDIATLFLDKDLNIRRFTNEATRIFKLIKSDIGRPFTDQASVLLYSEMADDAFEVLRTHIILQKQIPAKDGRWFSVRIMPYRTFDDIIDGLVITFINITELKKIEEKLSETTKENSLLLKSTSDVLIELSTDLKVLEFNPEAEIFFGIKKDEVINQDFIQMFVHEPVRKRTENTMIKLVSNTQDKKFKTRVITPGGNLPVEWSVKIIHNINKKPTGMILIFKR